MSNVVYSTTQSLCILLRSSSRTPSSFASRLLQPLSSHVRSFSITPSPSACSAWKQQLPYPACTRSHTDYRAAFHSGTACFAKSKKTESANARNKKSQKQKPQLAILSEKELEDVFETKVSEEAGNAILQILQERRKSGSLVEYGVTLDGQYTDVPQSATANALKWLRKNYPVDEQRAATHYADQQERKAKQLGIATGDENEPVDRDMSKTARTTHSVLDEYKKRGEERLAAEEEEKLTSPEFQKSQELRVARREEQDRKRELAKEKRRKGLEYWAERARGQDKLPDMAWWQRLLPGTIFAAVYITCIGIAADLYMPPTEAERLFPEVSPAAATVAGIFAINLVVWALWKLPPMWRYLNMYCLQVPGYPYALSLLGNTFSHLDMPHLLINMSGLMVYGYFLHEDVGRGNFVALYLSSAVFASCGSLWYYVLTKQWEFYSRGASGAIWGIMTAWAYFTSTQPQKEGAYFYIDCILYATLITQLISQVTPGIMRRHDVPAHLFGALMGLIGSVYLKSQAARRESASENTNERVRKELSESKDTAKSAKAVDKTG